MKYTYIGFSVPLRLDNDYALYCMEHHTWETIQVRYKPNQLSKLESEEYTQGNIQSLRDLYLLLTKER